MHWEIFLIPLIAMGVWLLGTIFRNAEEERARMARRLPGDGGLRVPQRRPVTDLDRFLEEARKRREAAEQRTTPQAADQPPAFPPLPTPAVRPPRPQRAERRPPRPREGLPDRPASPPRRSVEPPAPVAAPLPPPPAMAPEVVSSRSLAELQGQPPRPETPPVVSQPAPAPPPTSPAQTPVTPTAALAQLAAMLRSPKSLGAAILLHEILGPPLSKRRRGAAR